MEDEELVQTQQLQRHREWRASEGFHFELPVLDSTYEREHEQTRLKWLMDNTADVPNFYGAYKSILELGCSTGRILQACRGVCGVDLSPQIIESNKALYPDRFWLVGDVTRRDWYKHFPSFHTVLLPGFLEHLTFEQAQQTVRDAKKLAKHRMLITIPDPEQNLQDATNFKHTWIATKRKLKELITMCEEGGWHVTREANGGSHLIRMDKEVA